MIAYKQLACVHRRSRGIRVIPFDMLVPYRVKMPRFLSHDSPQLMPCITSGMKDHVFMQSIQDVDMQYPEKPPFTYKQTAEEKMEDTCLRMLRVMFGGPSRLDNQDRRKTNQEHDFTCVKSSWNQFCKVPGKALNIEDALFNMNKAICEAYLLANFHVMRMCKERKPLDELSQSFYYKCLKAVSIANRQKIVIREQDLQQSAEMYLRMRPKKCPLAQSDNLSAGLHNNASQQMATNTKNYIAMTFHKRLSRYVKHRYKLDGAQTRAVMTEIYALHYTGDNAIVIDLRQKIPQRAAVGNLENRPHVYLPLLYEILQYCEKNNPTEEGDQQYDKKAKHVRLFSLLPTKSGFESSNIKICGTGLYSLLKRQGILEGWTEDQYEDTKDQWWRCLFQIEKFETEKRTFAGEILTDGVSVSIMMRRKKPRDQFDKEADLAIA